MNGRDSHGVKSGHRAAEIIRDIHMHYEYSYR